MHSFTSLITLAAAIFAAAPISASSVQDIPAALYKRQAVQRGRPNHADLYGYPHGRGDHSGTRNPPPTNNQPMTPGGYVDPRPSNDGAQCRYNSQCSTGVKNARAFCQDGKCTFSCLTGTYLSDGVCTGQIAGPRCSYDRQCNTNVPNAKGICSSGRCNFACNSGFRASGSTCVASDAQCGGTTCPTIANGYTTCAGNVCQPHCAAHLGYRMYCNADQTVCQCTATQNDPNNCGTVGNTCPGGYNGKGRAYCSNGTCELSCHRLQKICPRGGACYCS